MTNNTFRSNYPYQSTTIYHVAASALPEFDKLNIFERVEKVRSIIFPFDYPTPENIESDDFKYYFETMFITKYINFYFAAETFEEWQLLLYSKMLEIMPVYATKLSYFFDEEREKILLNQQKSNTKTTAKNKNINATLPIDMNNAGMNIDNVHYADNGGIVNNESDSETTVTSGAIIDALSKFSNEFNNVFSELLFQFKPLFSRFIQI